MDPFWKQKPVLERGVICGCDSKQEWLLPWWWERYSFYNNFPVLFCDYGMSEKAKAWCRQKGQLVTINFDETRIRPREDTPREMQRKWEKHPSFSWPSRSSMFKKPFAMLESPFKLNVWLDMDCEVLSPLEDLFDYCSSDIELAISSVTGDTLSPLFSCPAHNGGVIVFRHGIDIIEEQAQWVLKWNHEFMAEDNILSYLICKNHLPIIDLSIHWNWLARYGVNLYSRIFHWESSYKTYLKTHDGIKPLRDDFEQKVESKLPMSALLRASQCEFST